MHKMEKHSVLPNAQGLNAVARASIGQPERERENYIYFQLGVLDRWASREAMMDMDT